MEYREYDLIAVTGCSLSCGFEMNDHELTPYHNFEQRQVAIWKWYMATHAGKSEKINILHDNANAEWERKEREQSWPFMLQRMSGLPVVNLASNGASVGESLVRYSNFLKEKPKGRILAVHQLPAVGRMFLRFDENTRVQMHPGTIEHGTSHDKKYFAEKIPVVNRKYRQRIMKHGYIEKHCHRVIQRLQTLSLQHDVKEVYIGNGVGLKSIKAPVLINDIQEFKNKYKKGHLGHPVSIDYNKDICEKILTIL